ncbi:MAG: DUF3106 domain-containing protein [Rubrivivax sp.]|nr:DUF3106 domain-containing protein [Rubrivivax sp.]
MPLLAGALLLALSAGTAAQAIADPGLAWASLSGAQKAALAPLASDWARIDANRKQKWLEVAARFPSMPADERTRVQARMAEWARLSPSERAGARLQFQEVRRLPVEERQAKWQAYQALTPEERQALAKRARPPQKPATPPDSAKARTAIKEPAPSVKRNLVATTQQAPTRVVAPTVVQAKPGATTTSMAKRAAPPLHHQTGLPKIAATPAYVNPDTLLPRRGPQGAAVRAAASADPEAQP